MHRLTCMQCAVEFERRNKPKNKNAIFCSPSCAGTYNGNKRREEAELARIKAFGGDMYLDALLKSDGIFEDIQERPQSALRIGRPVAVERGVSTAALAVGHG